jgi:hypothetical protein
MHPLPVLHRIGTLPIDMPGKVASVDDPWRFLRTKAKRDHWKSMQCCCTFGFAGTQAKMVGAAFDWNLAGGESHLLIWLVASLSRDCLLAHR